MKPNQQKTFSVAEKTALLEDYQSSGKTQREWSKENGIGLSTLQSWLRQRKSQAKPLQNWLPIIPTAPAKSNVIAIQVGKCSIPIDRQADLDLLADVLKVLVEVC